MKMPRTNIEQRLLKTRNKQISEETLWAELNKIFEDDTRIEEDIIETLEEGYSTETNAFDFDLLETDKIFHIDQIKQTCITYRLRFLDSKYFKGQLPVEALHKIKHLQKSHQTELEGFKIMAPSKLFKLKNADDPLLFAPIGNGYYYLIHKWGNDLNFFRKLMMWPFRSLENLVILIAIMSVVVTAMLPENMFTKNQTGAQFMLIVFFMFNWIGGIAIFYGFKKGKNFSPEIWNSKYYNA